MIFKKLLKHLRKHFIYYLSFLIPALLIGAYFAYRGAYPFGPSSLLTVDLGQQYIDFFAFFKASLLHHPETLIYAFSKSLGGDMVGVSAYYLISPFNLIFLITPQTYFPVAIYLITVLKFGCAGLTAAIFFKKADLLRGWLIPAFAVSYGLCSYLVVNHFNLMWLDGVIMLPLVMLSLTHIDRQRYPVYFALSLGLTILLNYYIGFMVVLFSILYFIFHSTLVYTHWRQWRSAGLKFISGGLLAVGLSCILLLPTISALSESKGQYTVSKIHWQFEFTPWHAVLKLILGSFSFDQMSTGYANIFTGSLALFGLILFFTMGQIPKRARITAFVITLFLAASICVEPLDLLWHGLQFPVWYPYRFSFVISFWMLLLAALAFKNSRSLKSSQLIICLLLTCGLILTALLNEDKFDFISRPQIILTAVFMLLTLLLLSLRVNHYGGVNQLFILVVTVEMGANLWMSLNPISYLNEADFSDYTEQLVSGANSVKRSASQSFYRIGKTYERTKNDPMEADYNGASQFNSMMEPKITKFFAKIGQAKGDGYVTYNNGTLFTDALLDMRYYLHERQDVQLPTKQGSNQVLTAAASRPDLSEYDLLKVLPLQTVQSNPFALPLVYLSSQTLTSVKSYTDFPLAEQEAIFHGMVPSMTQPLYTSATFDISLQNMRLKKKAVGLDYEKINAKKPAKIILRFTPDSSDPYYLTWGSSLNSQFAALNINGRNVTLDDSYENTLVFGAADQQAGQKVTITITPQKNTLWLDNVALFKMDANLFKVWANRLQSQRLRGLKVSGLTVSGTAHVTATDQLLTTSIPNAKGWHVLVDGQPAKKVTLLKTFIGVRLKNGTHHIKLYYVPPFARLGSFISLTAVLLLAILQILQHRRHFTEGQSGKRRASKFKPH